MDLPHFGGNGKGKDYITLIFRTLTYFLLLTKQTLHIVCTAKSIFMLLTAGIYTLKILLIYNFQLTVQKGSGKLNSTLNTLLRTNRTNSNSTLRTAKALNDPYESDGVKLYSTDRKGT